MSGKIVRMGIAFFVSVATARYLGPANLGIVNYASALVTFFASICTLGINSIIIKDFVDSPDEQGRAIGTSILLRICSSFLSSLILIIIAYFLNKNDALVVQAVALTCIGLEFQAFDTLERWFQCRYESKTCAFAEVLGYFATAIYRVYLLLSGKSVLWFAFATAIDYIVVAMFLCAAYKKYDGPKFEFNWIKGKQLLSSSYHYILSGMMVAIYGNTDKIMLKHMIGEQSVGYYSLASSLNATWVFILAAIIDSLSPTIYRLYNDKEAFCRKNRQLYAAVIYISIFVGALFFFFGKFAIKLLYGDQYSESVGILKIIVWYTMFSYLGVARNAWMVCENKQYYLKYIYFCAAGLNILLNALFIPIWGANGAAVASLITQIMTGLLLPFFIKDLRLNVKLMIDALLLQIRK